MQLIHKSRQIILRLVVILFLIPIISFADESLWQQSGSMELYHDVRISTESNRIAASVWDDHGHIVVWDMLTSEKLDEFDTDVQTLFDLSPDGMQLLIADWKNDLIVIHDIETKTDIFEFEISDNLLFRSVRFLNSEDQKIVFMATNKEINMREILIIDPMLNKITARYELVKLFDQDLHYSSDLYISENGKYIAYHMENTSSGQFSSDTLLHQVGVIDVKNDLHKTKLLTRNQVRDIKFQESNDLIFISSGDHNNSYENVIVIDKDLNKQRVLKDLQTPIYNMEFSNNETELILMGFDSLYNVDLNLNVLGTKVFNAFDAVRIINDSTFLKKKDHQIRIQDINTNKIVNTFERYEGTNHRDDIKGLEISPDDQFIYTSSRDGALKEWDSQSGDFIRDIFNSNESLNDLVVSDNYIVFSSYIDWNFYLYVIDRTLNQVVFREQVESNVQDLDISANEDYFITGDFQGNLIIYSFEDFSIIKKSSGWSWIKTLDISHSNNMLAVGNSRDDLRIFSFPELDLLFEDELSSRGGINSLIYSNDDQSILLACGDGYMKLINSQDLQVIASYNSRFNNDWSTYWDIEFAYNDNAIYGALGNGIKIVGFNGWTSDDYQPDLGSNSSSSMLKVKSFNSLPYIISANSEGSIYKWHADPISGILEDATKIGIEILENPVKDKIEFDSDLDLSKTEFILSDIQGKTIKSGTLVNDQINVSDLNSGYYFITLQINNRYYTLSYIK